MDRASPAHPRPKTGFEEGRFPRGKPLESLWSEWRRLVSLAAGDYVCDDRKRPINEGEKKSGFAIRLNTKLGGPPDFRKGVM